MSDKRTTLARPPRPRLIEGAILVRIAIIVLGLAACAEANRPSVDLLVDTGGCATERVWPLGVGVPFPKGMLPSDTSIALMARGEKQEQVAAAFETRAKWDDGSVQWLWIDFQGRLTDRYQLQMTPGERPKRKTSLQVEAGSNGYRVATGKLSVLFSADAATPVEVTLSGGPQAVGDGRGAYVVDQKGRRAVLGGPGSEIRWTVETQNPERAVFRVEGRCMTADGDPLAALLMRYDFRADQPWFEIEHRLVVTRDTRELWFQEYGVTLPTLAQTEKAIFGADGARLEAKTGKAAAWMFQKDFPRWSISATQCIVGTGLRENTKGSVADGWALAVGQNGGTMMAVRDFAARFPKELEVAPGAITAKLWSRRGGVELDYRPATLLEHFWGKNILDQVPVGQTKKDINPQKWIKEIQRGRTSEERNAQGTARTHRLLCAYEAGNGLIDRAAELNAAFQRPPVVAPDPAWSFSTGVFPPLAAKNAGRWPREEAYISCAFDVLASQATDFPLNGWYDFGAPPLMVCMPQNVTRAMRAAGTRQIPFFYRSNYLEPYNMPKHIWLLWARSGDRKYLDFGQRNNEVIADYRICHSGRQKGYLYLPVKPLPVYWGSMDDYGLEPEVSSDPFAPLWMAWFLRDDRQARDAVVSFAEAVSRDYSENYARSRPGYDRGIDMRFQMLLSAWRVTRDPALLEKARYIARGLADPESPYGISPTFERGEPLYKYYRKLASLYEYECLFGPDERVEKALDRAVRDLIGPNALPIKKHSDENHYSYQRKTGPHKYQPEVTVLLVYAWRRTKDETYRKEAKDLLRQALDKYFKQEDMVLNVTPYHQGFPFYVAPQYLAMFE